MTTKKEYNLKERKKKRKARKEMIKYRMEQSRGMIKYHLKYLDELKKELDKLSRGL